ncbi:hypothetical protein J7384_18495 [Endozoicomonas sp. G2_1]|uniref:DUF6174 domain-containing protein n=1 Tax=Endozoicomonas sp. G2_1 TaxID=2821091 RepID=UPI001AD97603|nr:hypothetical protein [Endozoicomonas sp. G2_1]
MFGAWFVGGTASKSAFVEEQQEISKLNRVLWSKVEPPNYSYSIWYGCMYTATSDITVSDGIEKFKGRERTITINELFDLLPKIFAKASSYSIKYNEKYGFPTQIKVDWSSEVYDDECFYQVQRFLVSE